MARREAPEINAGSMADIAFLLLIFFLVTTTMDVDKGISRKLPPIIEDDQEKPPPIKEKNVFVVLLNSQDGLFVEDDYMDIEDLREAAKEFMGLLKARKKLHLVLKNTITAAAVEVEEGNYELGDLG